MRNFRAHHSGTLVQVSLMPVSLSSKWFRACCGLVVLLLVAGLLWNPAVDAADEIGAGGTVMAEACGDADQPDRDATAPMAVDITGRIARTAADTAMTCAHRDSHPGPVFPPPERPPRA